LGKTITVVTLPENSLRFPAPLRTRVKLINHAGVREVYKILILSQWRQLEPVFNEGAERARIVAKERGYDWNTMTENEF